MFINFVFKDQFIDELVIFCFFYELEWGGVDSYG